MQVLLTFCVLLQEQDQAKEVGPITLTPAIVAALQCVATIHDDVKVGKSHFESRGRSHRERECVCVCVCVCASHVHTTRIDDDSKGKTARHV